VQRVAVKVGDAVRTGQLIAELDPRDYDLQMQEAKAALEQAQAQARNTASNYERVRALYENRNASRNDLDAARAADESAKAAVESSTKRYELAQSQFSYTKLTAPVDGAIATLDCEVNENVKAGDKVAFLTSGGRLEVEVGVPEILISQVREGEQVTVTFDASPGQDFDARVTEVGIASTDRVSTFLVTVLLSSESADIRQGMAAQVAFDFTSADGRERFVVPPVAVGEDREGRFVYTVESTDGELAVVRRQTVTTGELTAEGLDILDGISDGDLLITAGIGRIEDGMTVKLLSVHEDRP
jgi:RND family efflux transporter MFP subunit